MAHANGIESFWAMLKRVYPGTYYKMSKKHLHRYVNEFSRRHNIRSSDTIGQMEKMVVNMEGSTNLQEADGMTECNVENRTVFCRDNLDVLWGINSECIDLIYLDPPFNKNKKFTASIGSSAEGAEFSDIFREEDVKSEWLVTIEEDEPELHHYLNGIRGVGKSYNFVYLAYMAIRLIECSRVLKSTGSIYLHCDPTMSHYLKALMDCLFGEDNFRNEVVWHYRRWTGTAKKFQQLHDTVFFYSKNKDYTSNMIYTDYTSGAKFRKEQGVLHRFKKGHDPVLVSVNQVDEKGVPENDV